MIDQLNLAIGIGLVISLLFSELFGLAAGGMVVPGYIALKITQPLSVVVTLVAAVITYVIVHSLASIMIIYGKRRTVLMILFGYMVGILLNQLPIAASDVVQGVEFKTIGYIIPGLIAIWIDRQGLIETLSTLLTASVVVHLIMILFLGGDFNRGASM